MLSLCSRLSQAFALLKDLKLRRGGCTCCANHASSLLSAFNVPCLSTKGCRESTLGSTERCSTCTFVMGVSKTLLLASRATCPLARQTRIVVPVVVAVVVVVAAVAAAAAVVVVVAAVAAVVVVVVVVVIVAVVVVVGASKQASKPVSS